MSEKSAMFVIDILKSIVGIYFDTFFVFYFFKVCNYEVIPLAKYYLTLYLFIGITFFLIKRPMKRNVKVPYFRIGVALQALYIALLMLLSDSISNYIFLVAIVKGVADGFYHFPKNLLNTEKVTNEGRQKFEGIVNIVKQLVSILIPILLGVVLTYFTYIEVGKVFFLCFIFMFVVAFKFKDANYNSANVDFKKFFSIVKEDRDLRGSLCIPILSGLTYSSGVMSLIVTLSKINNFKTNLNLGFVDSLCAFLSLLVLVVFTTKLPKEKFGKWLTVSGVVMTLVLLFFAVYPSRLSLIVYLIANSSAVALITRINNIITINLSNGEHLKTEFKTEYYLIRDILYAISRSLGYILLMITCFVFGMEYINYLMILCAVAIAFESVIGVKLNKKLHG